MPPKVTIALLIFSTLINLFNVVVFNDMRGLPVAALSGGFLIFILMYPRLLERKRRGKD